MVFPGRFSTGCMRCRQRKVKCDEGKPSCRRCYIYGKPCPGYTDQFHFRHRSTASTASASKPKAARKGQVAVQTVQLQFVPQESAPPHTSRRDSESTVGSDHDTTAGTIIVDENYSESNAVALSSSSSASSEVWNDSPATDVWSPGILTAPTASYDHASVCYFVRRFVSPDETDGFPGHLSFLPELYDHNSDSVLELATLSVAQMAAYNQFGGDEFKLKSYQNYGRALRSLQNTITVDAEATQDKVVTAVLLLSTLNDITGDKSSDPDEHGPGLYYLLEKRGLEQLATRRGVELFLLALIRLQVYSFLSEDYSYSDPGGIATLAGLFDPLLRAFSMMSKTLTIRNTLCRQADAMGAQDPGLSPPLSDEETASLIQTCFESLEEFDEWDREAASYWQNTFEGRTLPTSLGEVGTGMIYCDPQTACVVVLVRSARLILLLSLLLYHDRLQQLGSIHPDDGRLAGWAQCLPTLQRDVHRCIDDMLASVPFALGDIDPSGRPTSLPYDGAGAIVILHPLRLIMYCGYATDDHMEKAKRILDRINASIGVRSAASWERAKFPLMSGFQGLRLNSTMQDDYTSLPQTDWEGSDMLFTDAL